MLHKRTLGSLWRILKGTLIKFLRFNPKNIRKIHKRATCRDIFIPYKNEINTKFTLVNVHSQYVSKGFSLTEILVSVGIMATISGIATMSYLKYYDSVQLRKIELSALQFAKSVEVCSIKYFDDFKKCANSRRLKFKCDDCDSTLWWRGPSTTLGDRIRMEMVVNEYRAVFTYREAAKPNLALRFQRTGTTQKFCGQQSYYSDGTTGDFVASYPVKKCVNDSDCKSNKCKYWPLPHWGGGSFQVIP